jgi:hypothetical protein
MGRRRGLCQAAKAVCLLLTVQVAAISARSASAAQPPGKAQAAGDRSKVLIRREVEAERQRRDADFERLRKLPPNPVRQELLVRVVRARDGRLFARVNGVWVDAVRDEEEDVGDGFMEQKDEAGRPKGRALVPASYFDDLVFGGGQEENIRDGLLQVLNRRIKSLKEAYALTPAQERKLLLAGKGDLKRLFDEVADQRRNFELARSNEDRLRDFLRDVAPLRFRLNANLFESQSLFAKTLQKMHEEKQLFRKNNLRAGASGAIYTR